MGLNTGIFQGIFESVTTPHFEFGVWNKKTPIREDQGFFPVVVLF